MHDDNQPKNLLPIAIMWLFCGFVSDAWAWCLGGGLLLGWALGHRRRATLGEWMDHHERRGWRR